MMNIKSPILLPLMLAFIGGLSASGSAKAAGLSPDTTFHAPSFAKPFLPERALLLPDGKYLLFFDPNTLTDQHTGAISRFFTDGTLDTSFNFNPVYKTVTAAASADGGKLYVAATRYLYGFKDAEQILRLNQDGSIDSTFTPETVGGFDSFPDVWQILVQPDAKVLVAGNFTTFAGNDARDGIVRLMSDGTVDATFAPVTVNGFVYSAALQADGKVLIGGIFTSVNGVADPGVARLNANGSLDSSFQATGFTRSTSGTRVRAIIVQNNDGLIILSGNFRVGTGNNPPRMPVLRLNTNGSVDSTFSSTAVASGLTGRDLVLQADNKIVAAINNSIYRLNTNGSKDTSFRQPSILDATFSPAIPGTPVTLQLYSDGRLLVGGLFTDVDPPGTAANAHYGVARINSDGTLDSAFVTSHRTGLETAASSFARLGDGSTLVSFADKIDPPIAYNVARLLSDGSLDPNFTLSSSDPTRFLANGFAGNGLARLPDGNFFVYGMDAFGNPVYGKVQPNGVEDTTFATNHAFPFQTASVAPDGKIYLCVGADPQMTLYANSFFGNSLGRLLANGQLDSFAVPPSIRDGQVIRHFDGSLDQIWAGSRVLAVQSDGRILFEYLISPGTFHLVRLNADGSFDGTFSETTFNPFDLTESFPVVYDPVKNQTLQPPGGVWTASFPVLDALVQPDGRIVLAGQFTSYQGTPARGLVRLHADGTIDNTFNTGGGAQWTQTTETSTFFPSVDHIASQADGKFLLSGTFEAFNGTPAPGLASISPNGSVDTSFVAPATRDRYSRVSTSLALQSDGSFLLSGPYSSTGIASPSLIRLLDTTTVGNLSTRLPVGTGENVLIEGFIVDGPVGSTKKIMVRAIGPSLAAFGISDALANPTLEIHDANNTTVATNDDWKVTQVGGLITGDQSGEIAASQLAPSNDLESAIIASLAPGAYTAVVRGVSDTTGTGVVDAYDLSSGSPARLANFATRGLIQPGDKLMIAGFIVQSHPVTTVVRAIGPSLTAFGISNALPDTTLQLRDQNGAIVLENDDWKTTQKQELEARGLQPSNDLEAALVVTVPAGQYTAQVRGKGDASGIGVVQVYFIQ
jgi:uncharacterized delta-60 repeat protein